MTKVYRSRRYYTTHSHHHHPYATQQPPIFCSKPEVELPKLVDDYLYNHKSESITRQPKPSIVNNELNVNLRQILRAYLTQFWRHEAEKELGGGRLWDEITGFKAHPSTYTSSGYLNVHVNHHEYVWWRQPAFALDDIPIQPASNNPKYTNSPSNTLSSILSSSSSSSSSSSASSSLSPNNSAGISPIYLSPSSGGVEVNCPTTSTNNPKTRWQVYAERLFGLLLHVPSFCLDQHMKLLIAMYKNGEFKKDTELMNIVRNYLSTVL